MEFCNQNQRSGFMTAGNNGGVTMPNQNTNFGWPPQSQQQYYDPRIQSKPLNGRLVRCVEEIAPNEVPMDGSYGFFPVMDGSAIIVSHWAPDGSRIEHLRFILDGTSNQNGKSFEQQVLERLDKIEKTVNRPFKKNFKKEGMNNDATAQTGNEPADSK